MASMAVPGPTTRRNNDRLAGNLLRLVRIERGWSQRTLADAAGVPVSTVARIESGARQPSLVTLARLFAAADLELRTRLERYDDHDDVLDARRSTMTSEQQERVDAAFERTTELLTAARRAVTSPYRGAGAPGARCRRDRRGARSPPGGVHRRGRLRRDAVRVVASNGRHQRRTKHRTGGPRSARVGARRAGGAHPDQQRTGGVAVQHVRGVAAGYADLHRSATTFRLGPVAVQVASLSDVIRSKTAAGRSKDLDALPELRRLAAGDTA